MKILMLTPYLPYPPSSGGQIRSYNLIKQLSKRHEITLCSLIKFEDEKKYVEKLEPYCKKVYVFKRPERPWTFSNILKTGTSSYPFLVIRNYSQSEKKALVEIVKEGDFDLIHAETFYVSPHIPKTAVPMVLVDQTIEYQVYQHYVKSHRMKALRPLLSVDVLKIKFWESFYWKRAKMVIAVSDKDAALMKKVVGQNKVRLVPNGVGEDLMENVPLHYNKTVLMVGNYAWLQNIEAARILAKKVYPKILKKEPEAKLLLVGQYTEKIKDLESDNIKLVDLAVDDIAGVQKAYQTSGILVAPLYGPGGTRLKILAAMAAKLPVVTTQVGIAGVGVDGEHFLQGETADEMAAQAIKLLQDKKLYQQIAQSARKLVEENYSYQAIAKLLEDVYKEVAGG